MRRNLLIFGIGMGLALFVGWTAFPRALYVRRAQPLEFQHKTHSEKSGLTQCDSCHVLGSDGEFSGIPGIEICAGCHAEKVGTSKPKPLWWTTTSSSQARRLGWSIRGSRPTSGSPMRFTLAAPAWPARIATETMGNRTRHEFTNKTASAATAAISGAIPCLASGALQHDGMKMSDCEDCHHRRNVEVGCLGCHQ